MGHFSVTICQKSLSGRGYAPNPNETGPLAMVKNYQKNRRRPKGEPQKREPLWK